jgi:hypothetical protein
MSVNRAFETTRLPAKTNKPSPKKETACSINQMVHAPVQACKSWVGRFGLRKDEDAEHRLAAMSGNDAI